MKLLSLFSGIGAFECALKRCGIPFELAAFCECDKYASQAYSLIHGESADKNLGDIRSAACSRFFGVDCVCYGFPCQDISTAGRQRGFSHNGERTRSGLFFEASRIIRECMPKIAIAENVKALTSKKFKAEFDIVLGELSAAGYVNYWAVLNARDFGLPQNRERVFIVSIRADIDAGFEFPAPVPLSLRLADVLERDVEEKFFIKETDRTREIVEKYAKTVIKNDDANLRQIGKLKDGNYGTCGSIQDRVYDARGIAPTLNTGSTTNPRIVAMRGRPDDDGHNVQNLEPRPDDCSNALTTVQKDNLVIEPAPRAGVKCLGNIYAPAINRQSGRVYDPDGLCATVTTSTGGNRQPIILEKSVSPVEANVGHNPNKKFEFRGFWTDVNPCLLADDCNSPKCSITPDFRIRKLTPLECWRLQGFSDDDFNKAKNGGISNTQLYKMAGNSIAIPVLCAIFEKLRRYFD